MSGNNTAVRITIAICATVIIIACLCACTFMATIALAGMTSVGY